MQQANQEVFDVDSSDEELQNHPMEPELDPLFKVLSGKAVATVPVKRTLLLAFANKKQTDLFDVAFCSRTDVTDLFDYLKNDKKRYKQWNAALCAEKLLQLHKMIEVYAEELKSRRSSQRNPISSRQRQDPDVTSLKKLIKECQTRVQTESERNKTTRPRRQAQHQGILQDNHPFDANQREPSECSYCNHFMIMPIENKDEIDATNAANRVLWEKAVKDWEQKPKNARGNKPKPKPEVQQKLACYCGVQNCLMRQNGAGCVSCEDYQAQHGSPIGCEQDPNGAATGLRCACPVCQCPCLQTYGRNERVNIRLKLEEEKRGMQPKKTPEAQQMITSVLDTVMSKSRIAMMHDDSGKYEVNDETGLDMLDKDAFALAATSLAVDPFLNANMTVRKAFQDAIGPLSAHEVCCIVVACA
jgi:hypothetical protein